jgi:alkylation response protein AidB-like acyl-CoA dehydrogenase
MASFAMDLEGILGSLYDGEEAPDDAAWQRSWLASPGLRLAGGTDEILRNIVAERVLGLPGEIRVDKQLAFQDIPKGPAGR